MCTCDRRYLISGLATVPLLLGGCMRQTAGVESVEYGREACTMCGMVISDPHFATEIRGGPGNKLVKFDDIGCSLNWLKLQDWKDTQLKEHWVMDSSNGKDWLDAHLAFYDGGSVTPMDYGFAAVRQVKLGSVDFTTMSKVVLAKGLSNRCLQPSPQVPT